MGVARQGGGGSSKATGCRPPGSWAQWDTRAGCSPRSCCTEPPGTVGSATRLCSTQSAPSGSFRQPPGRSCAPTGTEAERIQTESVAGDKTRLCSRQDLSQESQKPQKQLPGRVRKRQSRHGGLGGRRPDPPPRPPLLPCVAASTALLPCSGAGLLGRLTRAPCTPRPLCGPWSPSQRPPGRTDAPRQRKERGPGLEALEILENSAGENWHFNWVLC